MQYSIFKEYYITVTVEPLYSGHPWDSSECPDLYVAGTTGGVLIKGDILISGVSL
jgi:hypothetical protein